MRLEWSVKGLSLLLPGAFLFLAATSTSATECLDYASHVRFVAHDARYGQNEICEQWQGYLWTGGWYYELRGWDLGDLPSLDLTVTVPLPSEVQGICRAGTGTALYVATVGEPGWVEPTLSRIDITDPASPVIVWTVDLPADPCWALASAGSVIAVGHEYPFEGLSIASDAGATTTLALDGPVCRLDMEGPLVGAIAYGHGVRFVDVTDPANPSLAGQVDLPLTYSAEIKLIGQFAYVIGADRVAHILDVSDPASPVLVNEIPGMYNGRMTVRGDRLFLQYVGYTFVYDITDPIAPELLGSFGEVGTAGDASEENGILCHAGAQGDGIGEIIVFDIEPLAFPTFAAGTPVSDLIYDIDVDGNVAHIAARDGFKIYDITDPTAPSLLATLPLGETTRRVALGDGFAYVVALASGATTIHTIDVHDPAAPFEVPLTAYPLGLGTATFEIRDDVGWVVQGAGVLLLDLSDPATPPSPVTTIPVQPVRGIAFQGDRAYLSVDGVRIFDLGDPLAPVEIGSFSLPNGTGDIVVGPDVVFVTRTLGTVYWSEWLVDAIDVSDPGVPALLGSIPVLGVGPLAWYSGYVLMGSDRLGLSVIDATDPSAMTFAGQGALVYDWATRDVAIAGDYVLMGDRYRLQTGYLPCLTVGVPASGVNVDPGVNAGARMITAPEPFTTGTAIHLSLDRIRRIDVRVLDAQGRCVRTLMTSRELESEITIEWDGRDDRGRDVTPGVYFVLARDVGGDVVDAVRVTRITSDG